INFTESWKPVVHSLLNDSFQMTVSVNKPLKQQTSIFNYL
ncbi:hypothetical protein TSPI_01226, partial [Trichinella spiralis]